MDKRDIDALKMVFLQKIGGAVTGDIVPGMVYNTNTKAYDNALVNLGTTDQPFDHLYVKNITVDILTITGSSNGGGGSDGGVADTARGLLEIIEGSFPTPRTSGTSLPSTCRARSRS